MESAAADSAENAVELVETVAVGGAAAVDNIGAADNRCNAV